MRAQELLGGKSTCCRSCSCRLKALRIPREQRVATATKASSVAAAVLAARVADDPYKKKYGCAFTQLKHLGSAAKQRCDNPNTPHYSNYGGRGILFGFPSIRAFAEWVLDNIGCRPSETHSLDRIDNSRGYEPGNLRWATRTEQARNKRAYRRTNNGERIRKLKAERPDLTYETLRLWVVQGASDEDILGRKKYARPSL